MRGDNEWLESRIKAAVSARTKTAPVEGEDWLDKVAGLTGASVDTLRAITELFDKPVGTTLEAIERIIGWLRDNPAKLIELVRPENVEGLFGGEYSELPTDAARGEYAMPIIADFLRIWLTGAPLNKIEEKYPGGGDTNRCKRARHFVLRLVPDLAFMAGLPARLMTARNAKIGSTEPLPIVIATLSGAVREGCDSPECLAVRVRSGRSVSRVGARAHYNELKAHFQAGQTMETFEETIERARHAAILSAFKDL
jgi:hypothetical protein